MFAKVFYNTGSQIIGKAITASITLLVTLVIGRTLGASGYGDYTKIVVYVGYFYTLADFGLNTIYVKIAPENETKQLKILIGLRLIIGLSLALIASLITLFLPYNQSLSTGFSPLVKTGIIIASITIVTQALFTSANAFYQKNLRYDLSTISAIIAYIFILTIAIFVTATSKSLLGYVFSYAIGGIVLVFAAFYIIFKRTKQIPLPQINKDEFVKLLKVAWPIGIALIFNLIYFRIDIFILSSFRATSEVGLYGLAYQFFEAALTIPIFFSNTIYPTLSTLYQKNRHQFTIQAKNWFFILGGISILLTFATFIISFFIPIIFGKSFAGSVVSLQILALGFPFFFISALLWHLIIILDKQKYLALIYAAGAFFNLVANLILIPKYGYIAASMVTVVSEALIVIFLALTLKRIKYD